MGDQGSGANVSGQLWTRNAPPVEASIRFSFGGFETSITIRADSGADLMPRLSLAIDYLKAHGAEPIAQAHPAAAPAAPSSSGPATQVCELHRAVMRRRAKNGEAWYSHQYVDETGQTQYCKGQPAA